MKLIKYISIFVGLFGLVHISAAGSCSACSADKAYSKSKQDIVATAVDAGMFNTLATALTTAGLVDTLKGEGPFTVFAPTDEAFAALPAGTVEDLLKPANREKLVEILTYHVVSGKVKAKDVVNLESADTVAGQAVSISVKGDNVMVGNAKVIKADVWASNGVIHVIDKVLIP